MANTQSNNITRIASASAAKSEVVIYLNRDVLERIINEYVTLKGVMEDWHNRFEKNKDDILKNSSGKATTAFWNEHIDFDHLCFYDMLVDMRNAVPTLEEASSEAKTLLLRCEDFYEILLGGGSYAQCSRAVTTVGDYYFSSSSILPMTPILFYNPAYYGGGIGKMGIYTDEANAKFGEISDANNELKGIIDSIETEGLSINEEHSAIDDECAKKSRLIALYDAFAEYVNGVNQFNESKSKKFKKIWETENDLIYQYERKYDYSYVTDEKEKAALCRVFTLQGSSTDDYIKVDDSKRVRLGKVSDTFITVTGVPVIDKNGVITGYKTTFGGAQEWLKDFNGNKNYPNNGCGIIAAVNQYLYLTGQTTITYEEYKKLAYGFLNADDHYSLEIKVSSAIWRRLPINFLIHGALPTQMSSYIQSMCYREGVVVNSSWDYGHDYETDYENMKKQLENGVPTIWAVHDFDGNEIPFHKYDEAKGEYYHNPNAPANGAASHYVIATGIYEDVDDKGKLRRMIEISSWGTKYYVDYDQYIDVVSKNRDNELFSSVMNTEVTN